MISAGRVLLMPKGAYNPSTTYEMLDIVSYNGSSYIAKGTTTGNLPTDTTYWQLSAYGGQAANVAGNFAELEISSVASMTHYADDIFVDENSQLMKATQTINIGDTIDVNTNCTPTTVEALITSLSDRVDSLDSTNRKLQGAIEISAQTDLHSLALGEYYKSQTSFYVTNAPVGINQVTSAKFRLTVEAALDNASQASSPLLLTLRTPDGKIFTQGYNGSAWSTWEQSAAKSDVDTLNSEIQTLTNNLDDEIETRAKLGAHNFADVSIAYATRSDVDFTNEGDNKIKLNGTCSSANVNVVYKMHLKPGTYIASIDVISGSHNTSKTIWFEKNTGTTGIDADITITTETHKEKEFTVETEGDYKIQIGIATGDVFSNLVLGYMIRLASDASTAYAPYAMTNRELTENVLGIVSNGNLKQISGTTPFADLKNMNIYQINSSESVSPFPGYGVAVLVIKSSSITGAQLAFCITSSSDVSNRFMAYRICYQGTYSNWTKISGTNVT